MSSYIISIHAPPWSNQSVLSACQFSKQIIENNCDLKAFFLYQDGVFNASKTIDIPSDELNGQVPLINFSKQYNIPVLACVTASDKRGLTGAQLVPEVNIAGLAEFAELSISVDHIVQFK